MLNEIKLLSDFLSILQGHAFEIQLVKGLLRKVLQWIGATNRLVTTGRAVKALNDAVLVKPLVQPLRRVVLILLQHRHLLLRGRDTGSNLQLIRLLLFD